MKKYQVDRPLLVIQGATRLYNLRKVSNEAALANSGIFFGEEDNNISVGKISVSEKGEYIVPQGLKMEEVSALIDPIKREFAQNHKLQIEALLKCQDLLFTKLNVDKGRVASILQLVCGKINTVVNDYHNELFNQLGTNTYPYVLMWRDISSKFDVPFDWVAIHSSVFRCKRTYNENDDTVTKEYCGNLVYDATHNVIRHKDCKWDALQQRFV